MCVRVYVNVCVCVCACMHVCVFAQLPWQSESIVIIASQQVTTKPSQNILVRLGTTAQAAVAFVHTGDRDLKVPQNKTKNEKRAQRKKVHQKKK